MKKKFRVDTNISAGIFTTSMEFDVNNNPIYVGIAPPGSAKSSANWLIRKLTYDGANNLTDIKYANAALSFDQVWDNRASLSYS